jgi:chondroitin 4-sulfotransferase 11
MIEYIFIHIPKTGGTSIRRQLGNHPSLKCYNHRPYEWVMDQIEHSRNSQFVFTIVRNPWDRILSLYHYWKQQEVKHQFYKYDKRIVDHIKSINMSFKQFIHSIQEKDPIIMSKNHVNPYIEYYLPSLEPLDYIGRFENLQQDFNTICDKIGIPHQQLPHANKSKHKHYTEYYDDETKQIVAERYAKDIEHFEYKFGE